MTGFRTIPLRNATGAVTAHAIVDEDVYDDLAQYRWHLNPSDTKKYVCRSRGLQREQIHRRIMGLDRGDPLVVDHINGDTLDNRRANLRVVTPAQNAQNQGSRGGSSRHRGVTWDRSRGKWLAHAQLNGRKVTLGRFADEDEAGAVAAEWRQRHMAYSTEGKVAA